MGSRSFRGVFTIVSLILVLAFSADLRAAVYTWDGGGGDDNWNTVDNWDSSGAPVSAVDTTVVFKGMTRTTPFQNIADPFVLNRLELTDGSSGFVVSGNALEFRANGSTQSVLYSSRTATSTISNDISIATGTTLTATFTTYSVNLNGLISGSGTLVKGSNAGGLNLNHVDNTFTGGLIYNNTGGANAQWNLFSANASGALGDGLVTLNGGNTNPYDDTTNGRPGGLIFHNTTTHDNNFQLLADSPISVGDPWVSSQSGYSVTLDGQIDLNGNDLVLRGPGSGTINGAIINSGGVTKIGTGTWTLAGANTYDGATNVNAGVLKLGSAGALGNTSVVTVTGGGTLDFNGISDFQLGNVTISGAGVDANTGALANTSSGAAYRAVMNLALAGNASVGSNVGGPGNAPGRLDFGGGASGTNVNLAGFTLTKVGSSELLWRVQTTTSGTGGNLVIDGGAVNVESRDNSLPTTTVNSGATLSTYGARSQNANVTLNAGSTLAAYNGKGTWTGTITLGGAATFNAGEASAYPYYSGGDLTISGPIIGSGSFTKIGANTLTLSGSNSYTGDVTVNGGILDVASAGGLGDTSQVTVAAGATVDLNNNSAELVNFSLSGSGSSGQGALVSAGAAIRRVGVTLDSDATISVTGGRFDIGHSMPLVGNGYTLRKIGAGNLPIRSDAGSFGAIEVDAGLLYFETTQNNMAGTEITINPGATMGMYYGHSINAPVILEGGTFSHVGGGGTSMWSGPVTVNSASNLRASGGSLTITGDISGSGDMTIAGPNTVTFSGSNSYTGNIKLNSGILEVASAGGLGDTSQVTVASGATVDLNGNAVELVNFSLAGTGTSGQGALVSSGAAIGQVGVTLDADATISVTGGRFDIGRNMPLVGNGYTLRKIGAGSMPIRSDAGSFGAIEVDAGRLYFETTQNNMADTEITINPGATMGMYYGHSINAPVILEGGTFSHVGGGGTSTWSGPVTVNADSIITPSGGSLRITGTLSGDGNVTVVGGNTLYIESSGSVGGMRGTGAVELGSGVTLAVGSSGDDTMWNSPVRGAGAIEKVGSGLLLMGNSANTYAGGTIVSSGDLASLEPGALGAGAVTLNGGTLNLAVPLPAVAGFGGDGAGWTANGSASIAGNVLTATTAGANQAGSAFFDLPVATSDFTVSFTYSADDSPGDPADGLAIVFQTDVRGPTALGDSGGGLGYRGISSSAAVGFNLYPPITPGVSNQVFVNGDVTGGYTSTSPVSLYGTPVDVELTYSGMTLTATLTQGSDTFVKTYTGVDLSATLGSWAFLGLTGGTGGSVARQQVSGFSYLSTSVPDTAYSNDLAVVAGVAGDVALMVTPVSTAYSMGNLAMGSGATLSVAPIGESPADIAYSLTLGATILDGPATFDVANNGTGMGLLSLSAIGQTNTASLTKTGGGTLALTGDNSYTGATDVQAGTLALSSASSNNTIASSADIRIADSTVLDVTGLAGASGIILASGQNLHGNGTVIGSLTVGTGSTVSAGDSPGHLVLSPGDYQQASLATMLAELSGNTQGATTDGYDWIEVIGTAGFADGAVVDVDLLDNFIPELGDSFDILTATGGIINADLSGLDFDFSDAEVTYEWSASIVSLGGTAEALRVRVVPEPGAATLFLFGMGALLGLANRRRRRD